MFPATNMTEYVWVNPKSDKESSSLSKFYHNAAYSQQPPGGLDQQILK